MMKILFTEKFDVGDTTYNVGDEEKFGNSTAAKILAEGAGKKMGETDETEPEKLGDSSNNSGNKSGGSNKGPEWTRKYWVGEDANLSLNIWDRGDFYGAELVRSERQDDDSWEDTGKVYLPSSKTLLEMALDLENMFFELKELRG